MDYDIKNNGDTKKFLVDSFLTTKNAKVWRLLLISCFKTEFFGIKSGGEKSIGCRNVLARLGISYKYQHDEKYQIRKERHLLKKSLSWG